MTLGIQKAGDRKKAGVLPHIDGSAAREAYLRGDFSTCLVLLDQLVDDDRSQPESVFLRSRTLLRLARPHDVIALLAPILPVFAGPDEMSTARMLYGSAIARAVDVDRGLELLASVAQDADARGVDRAIRAEIAYYRALAYWTKREFRDASRFAVVAERVRADVLSVRAAQLRGFIALAGARYTEALDVFRRAHYAYGMCRGRDIDLATQILLQISALEQILRSAAVPGSHASPAGRTIAGSAWGPAVATPTRLLLCYNDAWLYAHDGDSQRAFHKAREAEDLAETPAWRVWALATRAIIATVFNERAAGRAFADKASELSLTVDWGATVHEERIGLLQLAEVYAYLAPDEAARALASYDAVTSRMDALDVLRDRAQDPRLVAWETFVRGLVSRERGTLPEGAALLRRAVDLFRGYGCLWRTAHALIELDATPVATRGRSYIDEAAEIVRANFPRSFLANRLGRWARIHFDPVAMTLTPAQRDVLRHLLAGFNLREIAQRTNRSTGTIGQHVKQIHAAFGTHSIGQLFSECNRRGIDAPGWYDEETTAGHPFGWVSRG